MQWLELVKIILKHAKLIQRELKKQKSATDDTPHVLTRDEIAITITEALVDGAIPEMIELFADKKKRR